MNKYAIIGLFGAALLFMTLGMNGVAQEEGDKTIKIYSAQKAEYEEVKKIDYNNEEWRKILTDQQFYVAREHGTERPFTGALLKNKENGVYQCTACGTDLFRSEAKYESGTGWPSFWEPIAQENIGYKEDNSLFMKRVEVHCPRCGAHLGHVFDDGPAPTHQRYCINSAVLKFEPGKKNE